MTPTLGIGEVADAPARLAGRLADQLTHDGHLTSEHWCAALEAVGRELFVPDRARCAPDLAGAAPYAIDRSADPRAWLDAVYSDSAIITQVDDGQGDPAGGVGRASSSLSAPGIAVAFLELLDPSPGDHVLEIGTGTGWTAAVLTHRTGPGTVTTLEIDPAVAAQADRNLRAAGLTPGSDIHPLTRDGADGHTEHAPYDHVHVTCGITTIPHAWITQTRPGGVIALPWMPEHGDGRKLRLHVHDDQTAHGRFHGVASYMMLRGQRTAMPGIDLGQGAWTESETRTDPRALAWDGPGQDLAITAAMPDVIIDHHVNAATGGFRMEMATVDGGSLAVVQSAWGIEAAQVLQRGTRRLWDEAEAARTWWLDAGAPEPARYGMTVGPHWQHLWLDNPDQLIHPEPAAAPADRTPEAATSIALRRPS
ncbi:methyltransferase domain-containing protein [Actinomadura harenae]|uniref:Protein-L-isoaspartate O-methyltransferase n=1 Tax=Actinomadura harenae TaxID=2483351 RepID=A0A3M2LVN7_9ACTN|nr:methyltransferase domain-containing protein [Actinomadura harenae]RMI38998.1 methyltransferase domain-containing protein [Actinomadura harenae]